VGKQDRQKGLSLERYQQLHVFFLELKNLITVVELFRNHSDDIAYGVGAFIQMEFSSNFFLRSLDPFSCNSCLSDRHIQPSMVVRKEGCRRFYFSL
jgi:hypothetical protein